jgi:xanthine dehydrogenase accessory factor
MTVLADPLAEGSPHREAATAYYRRLYALVEQGQGCTEAVVTLAQLDGLAVGDRYLFDAHNQPTSWTGATPPPTEITGQLVSLGRRPAPFLQRGVAYLPILPRITLLVVGGGHVGQAVARLASDVDFDIWVLDDRERFANRERFPTAQRLLVGDIGTNLKELAERDIDANSYCLIMTRGHNHDEEALYHLARTPAGYVGMIGSKRKIKLIYEDLLARGIPAAALDRVHAPLGFAIGSQTVPEIAISIVAELIACRNLGGTIPEARVRVKTGHASP